MSLRRWPDTLPGMSIDGAELTPVDPNIRTAMEVGAQRVRTRTKARLDRMTAEWRMTEAEFTAFRAWYDSEAYSLAGASDSLAGWTLFQATRSAGASLSPDAVAVDRIIETASAGAHRASLTLPGAAFDNMTLSLCASFKPAGRTIARLALIDRANVTDSINIDLATGLTSAATGILSQSVKYLGGGWYRVGITVNSGVGTSTPILRLNICDGTGSNTYTGNGVSGLDVCDVQARIATGYDLFLPTDTDGTVLGASSGAAWFNLPVTSGGGLQIAEARFTSPPRIRTFPGLNRSVTAEVEIRNA